MIAMALISPSTAIAWTSMGVGTTIEIGGNIQITSFDTPWEVNVGTAVTTMDVAITNKAKVVSIPVPHALPILGIRPKTDRSFSGLAGINPQISYNGAVQIDNFVAGTTVMRLPVKDADSPHIDIGVIEAPFFAAALSSQRENDGSNAEQASIYAASAGNAFWGGVAKTADSVASGHSIIGMLAALDPEYMLKYDITYSTMKEPREISFKNMAMQYSAIYGAGIMAGRDLTLTLKQPIENKEIKWKASLPITVSYQ